MIIKRKILEDLQEILEACPLVSKVSQGKPIPLQQEDRFPAVYIMPDTTTYDQSRLGTRKKDYDDYFFVLLKVNTNNTNDDLDWVEVEDSIIKSILSDTEIWDSIIDRNVVTSGYDNYSNYPKREFEVAFEFRLRETEC